MLGRIGSHTLSLPRPSGRLARPDSLKVLGTHGRCASDPCFRARHALARLIDNHIVLGAGSCSSGAVGGSSDAAADRFDARGDAKSLGLLGIHP